MAVQCLLLDAIVRARNDSEKFFDDTSYNLCICVGYPGALISGYVV